MCGSQPWVDCRDDVDDVASDFNTIDGNVAAEDDAGSHPSVSFDSIKKRPIESRATTLPP